MLASTVANGGRLSSLVSKVRGYKNGPKGPWVQDCFMLFVKDGRVRPWLRCLVYLIAFFALGIALTIVASSLVILPNHGRTPDRRIFAVTGTLALDASLIVNALWLRRHLDHRPLRSLGFPFAPGWVRLLLLGIAFGASGQLVVFILEMATGNLHMVGFGGPSSVLTSLAILLPGFAIAALAEEMAGRGYLFQNLWEQWGRVPAIIITSLLFAGSHFSNPGFGANLAFTFAGLALFGVLAGISVIWTKSVWFVLGIHFAWNIFEGPVFGFPVSGLPMPDTIIHQAVYGPAWYTGGPFGPEAGASGFVAISAVFFAVYLMYRRGAFENAPDFREEYAR